MSSSLLLCLCVCFPLANPYDYFPPRQVYPVAEWEAYTDHTDRYEQNSPPGRSYMYRHDWTGHKRQRSPVTSTARNNWSRESGYSQAGLPLDQLDAASQVDDYVYDSPRKTYEHQTYEQNINPTAFWNQHSSQDNTGYLPNTPSLLPQPKLYLSTSALDTMRPSSHHRNPLIYSRDHQVHKSKPLLYSTPTSEVYDDVFAHVPKENNKRQRTTDESYFGKASVLDKSVFSNQDYVVLPWTRPFHKPYDEVEGEQFNLLKSKDIFQRVHHDPFQVHSERQANEHFLPSLSGLINQQERLSERINTILKIHQNSAQSDHANKVLPLPQSAKTPDGVESKTPIVLGIFNSNSDYELFNPEKESSVEITKLPQKVKDSGWLVEENKAALHHEENENGYNNYKTETSSTNGPFSANFDGTTVLNQQTTNSSPQPIHGANIDEGSIPIQWESCVGPGDVTGHCVPVMLCNLENSLHHYSANQRHFCVVRHKQSIGICCTNLKTDAVVGQLVDVNATAPVTNDHPDTSTALGHHHHEHHHQEHCIYPIADYTVCGRSSKMMSNITTQAAATERDWPWMAVLVFRSSRRQFCGGTLITRRHVLTAAHCFRTINASDILVVLGDYDVRLTDESRSRAFAVERLISNDDYDPATHENDIALLVLNTTTTYNSYIQPACLPAPGPRYTNVSAVTTGWGRIRYRGQLPDNLMEVPLPVWEQDLCIPRFAQTIFNTSMCAGAYEGGRDSCQGDSGGPLVTQCHHSHRWIIIGVVSWGIRCAERDKPGIYTRVNEYLDWIHENIVDNTTDTSIANTSDLTTLIHGHPSLQS